MPVNTSCMTVRTTRLWEQKLDLLTHSAEGEDLWPCGELPARSSICPIYRSSYLIEQWRKSTEDQNKTCNITPPRAPWSIISLLGVGVHVMTTHTKTHGPNNLALCRYLILVFLGAVPVSMSPPDTGPGWCQNEFTVSCHNQLTHLMHTLLYLRTVSCNDVFGTLLHNIALGMTAAKPASNEQLCTMNENGTQFWCY